MRLCGTESMHKREREARTTNNKNKMSKCMHARIYISACMERTYERTVPVFAKLRNFFDVKKAFIQNTKKHEDVTRNISWKIELFRC